MIPEISTWTISWDLRMKIIEFPYNSSLSLHSQGERKRLFINYPYSPIIIMKIKLPFTSDHHLVCASVPELCCEIALLIILSHIFLVVKINLYIQRWRHFSLSGDRITSLIIGFFIPLWLKRSRPDLSWV